MEPFIETTGIIAPLLSNNIDTDVIMPKQFLKGIDRNGLDKGVFFDQRFLSNGKPNPDFVLNKPQWNSAKFLAVGENFGCGSSREHAVWGLKQLGIRAIIGTTFAGIFYDNCQRNGLLIIELSEAAMASFSAKVASTEITEITINLPDQNIKIAREKRLSFEIDAMRKASLLEGLDAIDRTLKNEQLIEQFEMHHLTVNPWLA